jgi:methyl-accepting chemotaxis protein
LVNKQIARRLTKRIDIKGEDEVDQVCRSVNGFIGYLQKMMIDVSDATTQIQSEIAQLKQLSGQSIRVR